MVHETGWAAHSRESKLDELLRQIADDLRPLPSRIDEAEKRAAELIRALGRSEAWMFRVLDVHLVSGNNVTQKMTRKQSQTLVHVSREAMAKLSEATQPLQQDQSRRATRLLKDLFHGSWA